MRYIPLILLMFFVLAVYGHASAAKSGPAETFKSACLQSDGGGEDGCADIIALCNEFSSVVGVPQGSRQACFESCRDVARSQSTRYDGVSGCAGSVTDAAAWCVRYCRDVYPGDK